MKKFVPTLLAGLATTALVASSAYALTQSITANVTFITPLAISAVTNANFGNVAGAVNATYTLDTAGAVTATGSGSVLSGGTRNAAQFTIAGSTTQGITISAGGYTADANVTPSAVKCKYGTASEVACDSAITVAAPGAGTVLKMGLTIATSTSTTAASAAPSYTMTVAYN